MTFVVPSAWREKAVKDQPSAESPLEYFQTLEQCDLCHWMLPRGEKGERIGFLTVCPLCLCGKEHQCVVDDKKLLV